MNAYLRPETTDALLTVLALTEAFDRGDKEAFQALTARDLTESRRHLRAALMLLASLADLTDWDITDTRRALISSKTRKDNDR